MLQRESEVLLAALDGGAAIVTANDRLARALRLIVADARQQSGIAVWTRPPIFSWSAWLQQCLDELLDRALAGDIEPPPVVLSPYQVEAVWESIIGQSDAGRGLLQLTSTAVTAAEAWDMLQGWRIPLTALKDANADHDDIHVFADWLQDYQRRSDREGWLDQARLADYIADCLQTGTLPAPSELLLAGFDELRPQQQALLEVVEQAGGRVTMLPGPEIAPGSIEFQPCPDSHAECRAAAQWTRRILLEQPDARIGIVVHNLAAERATITRVFDEVLCPATRLPGSDPGSSPYNISLGLPLADLPPVYDALQLLALGGGKVEWSVASALLRSPYVAGAETERDARARLDARLRRRNLARLDLRDLHYWADTAGDCPLLVERLTQGLECLRELPTRQSSGAWAGTFSQLLNALGWSHGRALDSREYQAVQAWWGLLAEFASLDAYVPALTRTGAQARLRSLAGRQLFQPLSAPAPVQILGVLEASGLVFDHLWILGLHDGQWPASPRPHPFIPVHLQRRYQLPHASAEREYQFAQRTTQRLLASAANIVVSWPQREGDAELRPSPLFSMGTVAEPAQDIGRDLMHVIHDCVPAAEEFVDVMPPPLAVDEPLSGGTAVLKNQAACPFRAFASHRLHALPLMEPVQELDALARGALVHKVMQVIWDTLGEQAALQQASRALHATVKACVEQALVTWERETRSRLPARFRTLESERLTALALEWLQLDADRSPFTVEACEAEQAIAIAGLQLRGRMDRLDRLPDGRYLIIDYKTGQVDPRVWLDDRPDDPQLPLYALARRDALAGIAFAQLRVGALKYAGVAAAADIAPGLQAVNEWKSRPDGCDDLPALLGYWQEKLTSLAQAFHAGTADVDPKDPRNTCTYCELGSLCRIDELSCGRHDLNEAAGDE
jgi:ATP-dependent helicase/nuclease subunit B